MVGKLVGRVKEANKNISGHYKLNSPIIRDFLINLHERLQIVMIMLRADFGQYNIMEAVNV